MGKQLSLVSGRVEYPSEFEALLAAYPKRQGRDPRAPAFVAFKKALKLASAKTIITAVQEYAKSAPEDRRFVPMLATFLNQQSWVQYEQPLETPRTAQDEHSPEQVLWSTRLTAWRERGFWRDAWGPMPGSQGFKLPPNVGIASRG